MVSISVNVHNVRSRGFGIPVGMAGVQDTGAGTMVGGLVAVLADDDDGACGVAIARLDPDVIVMRGPWRLLAQAVDLLLDPVVAFRPPGDGEALEADQFDIEGRAFGVEDIVLGECLAFAHYREARFVVQGFQAPSPTLVASIVVRSRSAM